MDYLFPVIIIYFITLAINLLILHYNVIGIGGYVLMLGCSENGILHTIALILTFFPPITFFLLIVIAIKNKTKKS